MVPHPPRSIRIIASHCTILAVSGGCSSATAVKQSVAGCFGRSFSQRRNRARLGLKSRVFRKKQLLLRFQPNRQIAIRRFPVLHPKFLGALRDIAMEWLVV